MKYCLLCLAFTVPLAIAENTAKDQPPYNENGITSYQEGDKTIEEYRVKGFLYSLKVIPKQGKSYYLINADGDDRVLKPNKPQPKVPSWQLFTW